MVEGVVKNIDAARGYGFVSVPGQRDAFFHFKELIGLPFDDQLVQKRVQFDLMNGDKGLRARNLREV